MFFRLSNRNAALTLTAQTGKIESVHLQIKKGEVSGSGLL
jgi:hypothetical protein